MTINMDGQARDRITIGRADGPVNVTFSGAIIATTMDALVLREKGHDPVYYIPKDHVEMAFLHPTEKSTTCPFKGEARYWSISAEGQSAENAVWSYDEPKSDVSEIAGYVAFDKRFVTIDDGIAGQDIVPGRDVE